MGRSETQRRTEKRNIGTENRTQTSHAIRLGVEEKKRVARRVASRGLGWCRTTGGGGGARRAPRRRATARARGRASAFAALVRPDARARSPRAGGGARREPRICRLEASVYVAREEADEPCARSGRVRTCAESTLSKVKASPSAAKEATPDARSATTPTTPQTPATAATTRERVVVDCFLEALRAAGVDPYPASVEVGIRDERAFIVTFYAHEWGSRATRTRNVRDRERTGDARVRASGRMRRAAAIPTTNTTRRKHLRVVLL